jgi:IS30 family transposase
MRTPWQLTCTQRYQISALKKAGHTQKEVAEAVGTSESSISQEVRRNYEPEGYDPKLTHQKTMARHRDKVQCRITSVHTFRAEAMTMQISMSYRDIDRTGLIL